MANETEKYKRRSIRLRDYDYSQAGAYFVTICTQNHKCLFGEIVDGEMLLNNVGQVVQSIWLTLPERYAGVELDQYMIMPNHLHGIVVLAGKQPKDSYTSKVPDRFEQYMYPKGPIYSTHQQELGLPAPALGEIIRTFKSLTTRFIRAAGASDFAWQGNYYDHIIRNDDDLDRIRQYMIDNPTRWIERSFLDIEDAPL